MSGPRTVKVRILAAVDSTGVWSACGWSDKDGRLHENSIEGVCTDDMAEGEAWFWITAELPVPEPQEVAGEVEEMDDEH